MRSIQFLGIFALWATVPLAYILQGQDSNWDLQNYHLYNTITLFEGSFKADIAPAGIQSYFNPLVSLPAYWIHRVAGNPIQSFWAGLALASFQGICGPLLFGIARTLLSASRLIAFLIAAFGVTSPILLSEAGTSFADLTICVLQLSAVWIGCLSLNTNKPIKLKMLALSWGVLGSACGIKFSAIFISPLLLMISLSSLYSRGKPNALLNTLKQSAYAIVLPGLIGFVLFGWLWLNRSWADNGNPFFPLFSSLFGESSILFCDSRVDTRFLPKNIGEFLLAPFREALPVPMQRSELAYRDLRPLLWVYGGFISLLGSLAIYLKAFITDSTNRLTGQPLGWVSFQIGILSSYLIWLQVAGIARYALTIQALSGLSLWISLSMIADDLQSHKYRSDKLTTEHQFRRRALPLVFTGLATICISSGIVPNWGRTNFAVSWNTLERLNPNKENIAKHQYIPEGKLFPLGRPVVLLDTPLAWLKQYAPSGTSFSLISEQMRPLAVKRVNQIISQHNDQFTAISFIGANQLKSESSVNLLSAQFNFKTRNCSDFGTPTGLGIRLCNAELLPE